MDRSGFWRWVRWIGLALLLLSGGSRYAYQAVWGLGSVLWCGTVGANGIEVEWLKDPGALARPQGVHFASSKLGRYEEGHWTVWNWSPNRRRIGVGIPGLIVAYLLAWTMAHYALQYRNRQQSKTPIIPSP